MKYIIALLSICFSLSAISQTPITSVPFELYGDHIIFKVSIDDSEPLDFIFDTGAGLTVIDKDVSADLKLSGKEITMNQTHTSMELIKHNKIEINGFLMEKNIKVYAAELDHLERRLGRDIDGIFGYDLMQHHTIHLDYDSKTLDIYGIGTGPVTGDMIPFYLNVSIPTIDATTILNNGEPVEGTFFVMTGAGTTLDFNTPFAEKNDVIHKTGKHFSYTVEDISGNATLHYEGHIKSLKFGAEHYEELPVGISQASSGIQAHPDVAGIIGNRLLSLYNITIDLHNKHFFFTPNSRYGKTHLINSAGIEILLSEDKERIMIQNVFEDSPAEEMGIMVGDELLKIDGKDAKSLSFAEIREILMNEGETVKLQISRAGTVKDYSIEMRSLIY